MIKRDIDIATGRKVIIFYYPYSHIIEVVERETAYRVKMMLESMQQIPGSMIFDKDDDRGWLNTEVQNALALIVPLFKRLSDGLNGDTAIFFDKEVNETESLGITVIDNETSNHPMLKHLDLAAEQFLTNKVLFAWYTNNSQVEAMKHYAYQSAGNINSLQQARDLIKKNRSHLKYPANEANDYPENYDMSEELAQFLSNE